jgi:hypothetical protein
VRSFWAKAEGGRKGVAAKSRAHGFWLVVLAEGEAFRWVVENERMAFSSGQAPRVSRMGAGDKLVFYMTRGAYHSPTRDMSHLSGLAELRSDARLLRQPLLIAGREFRYVCDLQMEVVLPKRTGPLVKPLVPTLTVVKMKKAWGHYFRNGLVALPEADYGLLAEAVRRAARQQPAPL